MTYTVTIDGTDYDGNDVPTIHTDEAPDVTVTFPGEEGVTEYTCANCGETTEEEPEGVTDRCSATECEACDGIGFTWPEGTTDFHAVEGTECPACETEGHGAHDWEPPLHAWVNSAGISVSDDEIVLRVSVGDPRGAFVMRLERVNYRPADSDGTEAPELRLSVPTPADGMPHMGLVPLGSAGYYRIVPSESPEHVAARESAIRNERRNWKEANSDD
jgi:Zn ribbon nucleic-acid-binding protein